MFSNSKPSRESKSTTSPGVSAVTSREGVPATPRRRAVTPSAPASTENRPVLSDEATPDECTPGAGAIAEAPILIRLPDLSAEGSSVGKSPDRTPVGEQVPPLHQPEHDPELETQHFGLPATSTSDKAPASSAEAATSRRSPTSPPGDPHSSASPASDRSKRSSHSETDSETKSRRFDRPGSPPRGREPRGSQSRSRSSRSGSNATGSRERTARSSETSSWGQLRSRILVGTLIVGTVVVAILVLRSGASDDATPSPGELTSSSHPLWPPKVVQQEGSEDAVPSFDAVATPSSDSEASPADDGFGSAGQPVSFETESPDPHYETARRPDDSRTVHRPPSNDPSSRQPLPDQPTPRFTSQPPTRVEPYTPLKLRPRTDAQQYPGAADPDSTNRSSGVIQPPPSQRSRESARPPQGSTNRYPHNNPYSPSR